MDFIGSTEQTLYLHETSCKTHYFGKRKKKKVVFWHIQIKQIQTILKVWKFSWEEIGVCYELKPCLTFACLSSFGGHFFPSWRSLAARSKSLFKGCNPAVILCTSLYLQICKDAIFMQSVTTWTNVYIFYINLSVCRTWEPFFMRR